MSEKISVSFSVVEGVEVVDGASTDDIATKKRNFFEVTLKGFSRDQAYAIQRIISDWEGVYIHESSFSSGVMIDSAMGYDRGDISEGKISFIRVDDARALLAKLSEEGLIENGKVTQQGLQTTADQYLRSLSPDDER